MDTSLAMRETSSTFEHAQLLVPGSAIIQEAVGHNEALPKGKQRPPEFCRPRPFHGKNIAQLVLDLAVEPTA
jgi:hypothetical protein